MNKDKITFILTLKGRDEFTKRIYNYYNETNFPYKILIGDGIVNSPIKQYLESDKSSNKIDYEYLEFNDETPFDYFNKLKSLLQKVDTPYVMLIDNDDYVIAQNIQKCIDFLDTSKDYVSCGGVILEFHNLFNEKRKVILNECVHYKYDLLKEFPDSPLERAVYFTKNHTASPWYNVYRTDVLKKCIERFIEADVTDFSLMEYFVSISTIISGKHKFIQSFTHYVRQRNSSQISVNITSIYSRMINGDLGNEVKKMLNSLINQIKEVSPGESMTVIKETIYKAYTNYLEKPNAKSVTIRGIVLMNFQRYLYSLRYFVPSINMLFRKWDMRKIKRYFSANGATSKEIEDFSNTYSGIVMCILNTKVPASYLIK